MQRIVLFFLFNLIALNITLVQSEPILPQQSASLTVRDGSYSEAREQARINQASAHFQRAHSLLLAALDEFNRGRKIADPSPLLNIKSWESNLLNTTKGLQQVLAPRPREALVGVKLPADRRLLGRKNINNYSNTENSTAFIDK
jgi:hypothetical protein